MTAEVIGSGSVAANSRTSWFIHGFNPNQAVAFSIAVFPGTGAGVPNPVGHATLTQGETTLHVDGTQAYTIYIQNNASFNSTDFKILCQVESL